MKKLFILAAAAIVSLAAQAQSASDSELSAGDSYNIVSLGYDRMGLSEKGLEYDGGWYHYNGSTSLNGLGIEYIHGFGLSSEKPMYLELGGKLSTLFGGDDPYSYTFLRLSVPVSFAWRFNITDAFSITPYAGLDFRVNLLFNGSYDGESESLFDDPDMNRFQMGWHIGTRFEFNRISLGLSYGTDFIKLYNYSDDGEYDRWSTNNLALSVGYRF